MMFRVGDLIAFLNRMLNDQRCQNDLRLTEQFCRDKELDFDLISVGLEKQGGYCDCEVVSNICETYYTEELPPLYTSGFSKRYSNYWGARAREAELESAIEKPRGFHIDWWDLIQGAWVAVDPETGEVLDMV